MQRLLSLLTKQKYLKFLKSVFRKDREEATSKPVLPRSFFEFAAGKIAIDEILRAGYNIIEFYPVETMVKGIKVYAAIAEKEGELYYLPVEPKLSPFEEAALRRIIIELVERYAPKSFDLARSPRQALLNAFVEVLIDTGLHKDLSKNSITKILYYVLRNLQGYGPIDVMVRDPYIEDISIPGVGKNVYVWHSRYENLRSPITIPDEELLREILARIATLSNIQLTPIRPIVDARTPEGFRVNIVIEPATEPGTATIRKFRAAPFTILELIKYRVLDVDMAAYIWYLVENKRSIIIFGATGAGKTTLLNAIAMLIRPDMKVVTIEDTREITLIHPHWVAMVAHEAPGSITKVTLFDLVKASLRQRPDYIIVGEIRGEEAYVLFQAIATGHGGLTTMHAESKETAVARLISPPMNIPPFQLKFIDAFIHIARVRVHDRVTRRILGIFEVVDVDPKTGKVEFNTVYQWTGEATDTFEFGGSIVLERIAKLRGVTTSVVEQEVAERKRILEELLRRKAYSYQDFAREVQEYYTSRRVV